MFYLVHFPQNDICEPQSKLNEWVCKKIFFLYKNGKENLNFKKMKYMN